MFGVGGVEDGDFMAYFYVADLLQGFFGFQCVLFFFEGVEGVEMRFVEPPASSFPPLIQIDLALHRHAVYS